MRRSAVIPRLLSFAAALAAVFAQGQSLPPTLPEITLTLRQAVGIAVADEGSVRVALAAELVQQARRRSEQSRAALLPQLDSSISQASTMRNLEALGVRLAAPTPGFELPRIVGPFSVFDARLTAGQSIFDISAIRRFQAARLATAATRRQQLATGDAVAADVARTYLAAVRAQDQLDAATADVELAEALTRLARNRKDAGVGTGIEITRALVQEAHERQTLLLRRRQLRASHLGLLRTIGLDLSTGVQLTTRLEETAVEPTAYEEALADALTHREDYLAAQQRLASARRLHSADRWERLPAVRAFADYGAIGSSGANAQPTRGYGVSATIPLFDGGRRRAQSGESASKFRQEEIELRDLRAQIELEMRLAVDGLEIAAAQMQVADSGAELAAAELEQARRRYEAGVGGGIEVTDAQTRLTRSRQNRLDALYAFNLARVDWSQARGRIDELIP